jgi:hypothetical protein
MNSTNSKKLVPAVLWLAAALLSSAAPADRKLAIAKLAFAQSEDGPALASTYQFLAGESVYFSCLVDGYAKSDKDEIFLTYQIQAKDARGVLLQPAVSDKVEATLAPEDKEWRPKLRDTIAIPPLADSGEYQVLVKVRDERNSAVVEARATFSVRGRDVAPSDTLLVRDFRFFRSEEDSKPVQVPAYRPGDTLWARFVMTGYKLGDGNQFDIEYGLTVLRADGTVAYSEPRAAGQKDQPFYPQRYQPGVLSLNFPKDQKLGEFTIVLTVRDNLGGQTFETRQKFSVE